MKDEDLWREIAKSVKPLKSSGGRRKTELPSLAKVKSPQPEKAGPLASSPSSLPPLITGNTDNIDRSTAGKFTRGEMEIEARIDLHGMTQAEAHPKLNQFIERCAAAGYRCVLVITGKGGVSRETKGVLRQQVPQWLNLSPCREKILSFSPARPQHGGTGALYVLLKRKR